MIISPTSKSKYFNYGGHVGEKKILPNSYNTFPSAFPVPLFFPQTQPIL